jgi:demethylmenaquinone methyltransferase/2-methoxy-6-polyprenyl-1,4-benzoquinol methylase
MHFGEKDLGLAAALGLPLPPMTDAPSDGSGRMFDRISDRYDLLNRVMSVGSDARWRRRAVKLLGPDVRQVLDLATGTADVAIEVARSIPGSRVVGVDPSVGMLRVGGEKVRRAGLEGRITLREGDGEKIPAEDDAFDGSIMAFGIRNVPDRAACLRELGRVVRRGGPIVLLELAEPEGHPLAFGARFWKRHVVPRLGALLSSTPEYAYLEQSIRAFPRPNEFLGMMRDCGLGEGEAIPLTFGAATLFVGRAP